MQLVYQVDNASYDWVKLDPALPATRAVVNQYLRLYFRSPDLLDPMHFHLQMGGSGSRGAKVLSWKNLQMIEVEYV